MFGIYIDFCVVKAEFFFGDFLEKFAFKVLIFLAYHDLTSKNRLVVLNEFCLCLKLFKTSGGGSFLEFSVISEELEPSSWFSSMISSSTTSALVQGPKCKQSLFQKKNLI